MSPTNNINISPLSTGNSPVGKLERFVPPPFRSPPTIGTVIDATSSVATAAKKRSPSTPKNDANEVSETLALGVNLVAVISALQHPQKCSARPRKKSRRMLQ